MLTPPSPTQRQRWIAVLARADAASLAAALPPPAALPAWRVLRGPETGLVMLRGRAGGTGAPFNLGEMTVTRCTLRLDTVPTGDPTGDPAGAPAGNPVGHATVPGRDARHAELAALADALLQHPDWQATVTRDLIAPLAEAQAAARAAIAARAAATKVAFFTLQTMRG